MKYEIVPKKKAMKRQDKELRLREKPRKKCIAIIHCPVRKPGMKKPGNELLNRKQRIDIRGQSQTKFSNIKFGNKLAVVNKDEIAKKKKKDKTSIFLQIFIICQQT